MANQKVELAFNNKMPGRHTKPASRDIFLKG